MGNRPFVSFNREAIEKLNNEIRSQTKEGRLKGRSESKDASGKKYPIGFTPPQDFYILKDGMERDVVGGDDGLGSINPNDTGIFVTRRQKGGLDPETGRHVEYGRSINISTDLGIKIRNAGTKVKISQNGTTRTLSAIPDGWTPNADGKRGTFFTPRDAYINPDVFSDAAAAKGLTGSPVEYGNVIYNDPSKGWIGTSNVTKNNDRLRYYEITKQLDKRNFIHLIQRFEDGTGDAIFGRSQQSIARSLNPKISQFGSTFFLQSQFENEDPTYYGFDLELKVEDSSLLNGDIDQFCETFGNLMSEVNLRKTTLPTFKNQLYKFIKTNNPNTYLPNKTKFYYIQSIAGLEKLVEYIGGDSESKQFAEYKKDIITLEFLEDVSQNIGYLNSLYRFLSYSKLNGKQIIPENLLRFNIDIIVTEIRKFNRYVVDPNGNNKRVIIQSDAISRYVYSLYECQFRPKGMPHGDVIKNNVIGEAAEAYKLSFDYKFATLNFEKFSGNLVVNTQGEATMEKFMVDNSYRFPDDTTAAPKFEPGKDEGLKREGNEYKIDDKKKIQHFRKDVMVEKGDNIEKNGNVILNTFGPNPSKNIKKMNFLNDKSRDYVDYPANDVPTQQASNNYTSNSPDFVGPPAPFITPEELERLERENESRRRSEIAQRESRQKSGVAKAFDQLKEALANAAIREANRRILTYATLINKTIETLRRDIPYLGRMSEPRNVYYGNNDPLKTDIINAGRDFLGNLINSFGSPRSSDRNIAPPDLSGAPVSGGAPVPINGFRSAVGPQPANTGFYPPQPAQTTIDPNQAPPSLNIPPPI